MFFSGHRKSLELLRANSDESQSAFAEEDTVEPAGPVKKDRRSLQRSAGTIPISDTTSEFSPKACNKEPLETCCQPPKEWPNGPPPSCPRSHLVDISPPATRRSDHDDNHYARRLSAQGSAEPWVRQRYASSMQLRRTDVTHLQYDGPADSGEQQRKQNTWIAGSMSHELQHLRRSDQGPAKYPSGQPGSLLSAPILEGRLRRHSNYDAAKDLDSGQIARGRSTSPMTQAPILPLGIMNGAQLLLMKNSSHLSPPAARQSAGTLDDTGSVLSDLTTSSGAPMSGRCFTTLSRRANS